MLVALSATSTCAALWVDRPAAATAARGVGTVVCEAAQQRSSWSIPKLGPFSRRRIDRGIKEPSFLQKTESDLTEYCSVLEGDDSYSCWQAYFELKDLEEQLSREDVEKLIRQAGGRKALIDCLHGLKAQERKKANEENDKPKLQNEVSERDRPFPVPDGLPKTQEEIEEEEKARMPDSPYTRLLRRRGRMPAWYSLAPDHETD